MLSNLKELALILDKTPLAGRATAELPILDTPETAFAIEIGPGELEWAWREMRGLLEVTQRWPVGVALLFQGPSWEARLREEDLFSRFFYQQAENAGDVSPRGILAAADKVDVSAFLARVAAHINYQDASLGSSYEEELPHLLQETQHKCGRAPALEWVLDTLRAGEGINRFTLERLLFEWEQVHCKDAPLDVDPGYQDWLEEEPYPSALLLLPTPHPWDTLAYLHFYAAESWGSEYFVALGRSWQERFGAELVAHYGTMLQVIARRPTTPQEAFQLALEHDLAAWNTLSGPGVTLRDHARYLLGHERWFLHHRP